MSTRQAIGVDIGGTKVAVGVVDQDGAVLARVKRPTPSSDAEALLDVTCAAIAEVRERFPKSAGVGVGTAGYVDAERSRVTFAPNLPWRDEPLRDRIAERVGLPTVIENDANAWTWGEARFGAGQGFDHLLCVTLGTGVGSGMVLSGQLHRGGFGLAAESGHMRVVPDGRPCRCGNRGCWETYASGRALVTEARERARRTPERASLLRELAGGDTDSVEGPQVTEAALAGDAVARESFAEVGRWVGEGLAALTVVLDPQCVVLGGGVAEAGDILLGPVQEALDAQLHGRSDRQMPQVRIARLGVDAALVGVADLARREDPGPALAPRSA